MAAQVEREGIETRVGGEITRLEQDNEDSNVDVVSIQSGDSFMQCLEKCGNSIRFAFAQEECIWGQTESEKDLLEEV